MYSLRTFSNKFGEAKVAECLCQLMLAEIVKVHIVPRDGDACQLRLSISHDQRRLSAESAFCFICILSVITVR